jgi:hypothetical protein
MEVFLWSNRLLTFSFDRRKQLLKTRKVVALLCAMGLSACDSCTLDESSLRVDLLKQ